MLFLKAQFNLHYCGIQKVTTNFRGSTSLFLCLSFFRPCVYTIGSPINNRALFPCQEPPVAMSTWQATVRAAATFVILMSGENSAKPTQLQEGTVHVLCFFMCCTHSGSRNTIHHVFLNFKKLLYQLDWNKHTVKTSCPKISGAMKGQGNISSSCQSYQILDYFSRCFTWRCGHHLGMVSGKGFLGRPICYRDTICTKCAE